MTDKVSLPVKFEPQAAKKNDAKADAVIDYAKAVHDWPTLETAVDQKMTDQTEFVAWWEKTATGPGKVNSRRPGLIKADEAITHTGITQQQVSKWRRRLAEPEKYQQMLYGAAYAKAMAAGRVATLRDRQRADQVEGVQICTAAEMLGVSERTVKNARKVLDFCAKR